jgi:phasin
MASSAKKGHRPAVKLPQPPLAAAEPEPPAYPVADISATALAVELSAPAVEPPTADFVEAPEAQLAPPVVESPALASEIVDTPEPIAPPPAAEIAAPQVDAQIAQAPEPVAPPPPIEAVAAVAPVETVAAPVDFKDYGDKARALIEKGLAESRAKFAQAKTAAEEASAAVEASYGAARDGVVAFNVKAIEALKASADANFDLLTSLASAKSISELVTLHGEFARKQFEETSAHAKALAELAGKVANDTVAPFKAHVARTFKTAV